MINYIHPRDNTDIEYRSFLQNILRNPDQEYVIDCSFEANPFWYNQEYSIHDPRPEKEKLAYWEDVERLKDEITQKNVSIKVVLGRYDLQHFHPDTSRSDSNRPNLSVNYVRQLPTTHGSGLLFNSFEEVICWPTKFLHSTILEQGPYLVSDLNNSFLNLPAKLPDRLFVSHMHYPKTHRLALLEVLIDNDAITKGTVRFCNNLSSWRNFLDQQHILEYSDIVEKVLPYAPNIFSPYKYTPDTPNDNTFQTFGIDPHYKTGFIDISPESHYNMNFITQKSCQPILWGKPFFMMGSTQQNTLLKDLGFEMFDEIFDLSNETDELVWLPHSNPYGGDDYYFLKDHYHKLLKNLWDVDDSQESIQDMKQKFSAKIEYNLNRYMQIVFDDDMLPEVQEIRESFEVTGSRVTALQNPYLQRYVPVDKRKDRK